MPRVGCSGGGAGQWRKWKRANINNNNKLLQFSRINFPNKVPLEWSCARFRRIRFICPPSHSLKRHALRSRRVLVLRRRRAPTRRPSSCFAISDERSREVKRREEREEKKPTGMIDDINSQHTQQLLNNNNNNDLQSRACCSRAPSLAGAIVLFTIID